MAITREPHKLLIAADADTAALVRESLNAPVYLQTHVSSEEQALNALHAERFDVVIAQLESSRLDGLRVLTRALDLQPELCVILVGHQPDIEVATEAMRLGAHDFLILPLNAAKLQAVVERGLEHQQLRHQHALLRRRLGEQFNTANLVGESAQMIQVYEALRRAANQDTPIILSGEPGTGKDFAAQTIHTQGIRHQRSFLVVPCNDYAPDDLEYVLFGHAADMRIDDPEARPGLLEQADGGTLYLQNPRELLPRTSDAIINAIQTGRVVRVGSMEEVPVDTRLVVSVEPGVQPATPLYQLLEQLENTCNATSIVLPPLRERPQDIPLLIEQFLEQIQSESGKRIAGVDSNLLDLFLRYSWPGNLRELRNTLEITVRSAAEGHTLAFQHLPPQLRESLPAAPEEIRIPPGTSLREAERLIIEETMKTHGFKKEEVAKTLDIGLRTLYRKLDRYNEES